MNDDFEDQEEDQEAMDLFDDWDDVGDDVDFEHEEEQEGHEIEDRIYNKEVEEGYADKEAALSTQLFDIKELVL